MIDTCYRVHRLACFCSPVHHLRGLPEPTNLHVDNLGLAVLEAGQRLVHHERHNLLEQV